MLCSAGAAVEETFTMFCTHERNATATGYAPGAGTYGLQFSLNVILIVRAGFYRNIFVTVIETLRVRMVDDPDAFPPEV